MYFQSSPKVQKIVIVIGLLTMPTGYSFMKAMGAARNSGEFSWGAVKKNDSAGSEMLQELAYIVAHVPAKVEYQWGYSYYVQAVNPIPRFLWPGKPTMDSGILMSKLKGLVDKSGEAYMTNSPGLIGEMYLNLGLFGVIGLSFLGGWLVRGGDRLIDCHQDSLCTMLFYCMGLSVLFILGRSFSIGMFYNMLFLYVAVWMVTSLMGNNLTLPHLAAAPKLVSSTAPRRHARHK